MGLRFVHVEPVPRQARGGEGWLELRLDENHRPPAYLATIRLHQGRRTSPNTEHVREVAPAVLARLSCGSVADYLEKGLVLARARFALEKRTHDEPFEREGFVFTRGVELVTTTLAPGERPVFRVAWKGEHALTYWVQGATVELCWASNAFRADARLRPRAVEHGFSYVPWALEELEPVRAKLLESPRALDLGLPLEVTEPFLFGDSGTAPV